MNNIDFYNLSDERIFTGDIEMIIGIDEKVLKEIKDLCLKDYFIALKTIPAKNDVTLIKLNENTYIDFDINKLDYINYCIENNIIHDNNNFLLFNPENPFIGQLIVTNIKKLNNKLTLKKD